MFQGAFMIIKDQELCIIFLYFRTIQGTQNTVVSHAMPMDHLGLF